MTDFLAEFLSVLCIMAVGWVAAFGWMLSVEWRRRDVTLAESAARLARRRDDDAVL